MNKHLILTLSNFIHVLIEIIHGRIVTELRILRPDEHAELGPTWYLEVLLSFDTSIGVPGGLIELNSDPEPGREFGHRPDILDLASAGPDHQLASLADSDLIRVLLLEIVGDFVAGFFHKVRVFFLHVGLKLSEGVVALIVLLLTDLILFNLRHILKLS